MEDHHSGQRDLSERRSLFVCYIWGFSLGDFEQTQLQYRQSPLRHLVAEYLFYDAVLLLDKGENKRHQGDANLPALGCCCRILISLGFKTTSVE
jgi:hypothetical protein